MSVIIRECVHALTWEPTQLLRLRLRLRACVRRKSGIGAEFSVPRRMPHPFSPSASVRLEHRVLSVGRFEEALGYLCKQLTLFYFIVFLIQLSVILFHTVKSNKGGFFWRTESSLTNILLSFSL